MTASKRNVLTTVAAVTAVLFGLLTVASGGRTLFGGEATRQAAGAIVPYVLWFNFVAGFAYVVAGVGLWRRERGAAWVAAFIAVAVINLVACSSLPVARYVIDSWRQGRR